MKFELKEKSTNTLHDDSYKLGYYHIGWEISYGIHIPVMDRKEAEYIMKTITKSLNNRTQKEST